MTPRDIFGIVVRTIGLLTLLSGVYAFGLGASVNADVPGIAVLGPFIVGVYLLRGAPHLLDVAYPPKKTRRRGEAPSGPMQTDAHRAAADRQAR